MRTLYTFTIDPNGFPVEVYASDSATDEEAVAEVNERLREDAEGEECEAVTVTAADITGREEMPDWDDFCEKYRPVAHSHDGGGQPLYIFEPLLPEHRARIEEALVLTPDKVWTVTHGDSNVWSIAPGMHPVNRVGVLITEVACADQSEEFLY